LWTGREANESQILIAILVQSVTCYNGDGLVKLFTNKPLFIAKEFKGPNVIIDFKLPKVVIRNSGILNQA
jgi:hypothetical protein